jgi:mRNA-decapping enzyme subunit 2
MLFASVVYSMVQRALRTFIGERKPRGIERKLPKPRSAPNQFSLTPDIQARTSAPSTTWTDANTQESSSQSSSPQTPSPKSYETLPEHASNGQIASASTDDILEAQVLDPHFARLLSSLSMSSRSIVDGQAAHTLIPKISKRDRTPSPTSATPVPSAVSSSNLRSVPSYSLDRADWSSHAPTRLLHRNGDLKVATVSSASSLARRDPPIEIPVAQVPPLKPSTRPPMSPSSHPETSQRPSPSGLLSGDPDPSSSTLSSSPHSLTSPSSYTPSSRRTSSTADISPYLSRPTEIPTLGKRLKQLALLERVADESMRMAPRLDHRPLPFGAHANPPNGAPQLCPPPHSVITRGAGVSGPRVSDPSMELMGYGQALTSDRTHMFDSRPFPHHFEIQDDPFQVRPRTSQALHRSPGMFSPTASLGRQSMNQHRLLSMINAPPLPSPAQAPSIYQGLPSRQLSHSVVHSLPFQSPSQTPARIPGPLHILPPYQFPSQQPSAVPPVSAPAKSSVFDIPPSTKGSSSLLSILNAGRGSRTGASTLT